MSLFLPKLTIYRAFILPNHHTHGGTEKRQPECKGPLCFWKTQEIVQQLSNRTHGKACYTLTNEVKKQFLCFPLPPSSSPLFSHTISFGLCFLPPIPPPCNRNWASCWVGYFITKHSFHTSKKDPICPPSQYDGKPCATCTRKPHLKRLFFFFFF